MRAQGLVHVVEQRHVGRIVKPAGLQPVRQQLLGARHAALGERDRLVLLVVDVVARGLEPVAILALGVAARDGARLQAWDDAIDFVVQVGRLLGRARDDQRRPRFVDQDAVHLVYDREVMPALDEMREIELHVVAQVVEPELVVGAVGDVATVGDLSFLIVQVVLDDADRHAEETVDFAHPLGVAPRQIVVDGDDVDAFAFEGIEVRGKRRDERLAFARLHFGDLPLVQDVAADQLHVEVPHVEHAAARLAHDGEGLGQEVVYGCARSDPLAEFRGPFAERLVAQSLDGGLQRVDGFDDGTDLLQLAFVLRAEDFRKNGIEHEQTRAANRLAIKRLYHGFAGCPGPWVTEEQWTDGPRRGTHPRRNPGPNPQKPGNLARRD